MTAALPDRIFREVVDIHIYGECDSLAARSQLERLCGEQLTSAIGELFDSWRLSTDQLVSIDKVQVEVSDLSSRNVESELISKIIKALRLALENRIGRPGMLKPAVVQPISQSLFEELLFFLERGYLPWTSFGSQAWIAAVNRQLVELKQDELERLTGALSGLEARRRLATHFAEATLSQILRRLVTDREQLLLIDDVSRLATLRESQFFPSRAHWTELLVAVATNSISLEAFESESAALVEQVINNYSLTETERGAFQSRPFKAAFQTRETSKPTEQPSRDQNGGRRSNDVARKDAPFLQKTSEGLAKTPTANHRSRNDLVKTRNESPIFIGNAGLVILAPYLPMIFRKLGLLEDGKVQNVSVAVVLQHYLVFGTDQCAEWDLVLNKILAGAPLERAIELPIFLSDTQKAEADLLLEAVISNWPALKNTSQDGLRATFLQREGALSFERNVWQLRLTRTAFDVLMDRLPWTISMTQLPWMPAMLKTDWAEA